MKLSFRNFNRAVCLGAAILAGASLSARPLLAAPAAGSAQFGSVDVQKVQAGYSKKGEYDQKIQALQSGLSTQLQTQSNSVMLSKPQQARLGELLAKTNRTDPENAEMTALQAQSTKDFQELTILQQKKDPAATDTTRMDALTKQYQAGQQALREIAEGYQSQIQKQTEGFSNELTSSVKAAISDVAKQRGLSVVFDSSVAIYTTNDITDDVVKRLNK